MDVFNLQASIKLDISDYQKSLKDAVSAGEELKKTVTEQNAEVQKAAQEFKNSGAASQAASKQMVTANTEAKKSLSEYRSDVAKLANAHIKAGMDSKEAWSKAHQSIDKSLYDFKKKSKEVRDENDKNKFSFKDFGDSVEQLASKLNAAFDFNAITSSIKKVVDAFKEVISVYAEYEQAIGGTETFFKSATDKVEQYAQNAYKTAGMSTNEYLQVANSMATSIMKGLQGTSSEAIEYTDQYISEMLSSHQSALDQTYTSYKRAFEDEYQAYSDMLSEEIAALKETNEDKLDLLKATQQEELDAFEELTDKKLAMINEQYMENLKLIDEEKYKQLKAIDEQIEALQNEGKAAQEAAEKEAQAQKIAELEKSVQNSHSAKKLKRTQKELADYLAEIAEKEREKERQTQIASLKEQREAVEDNADEQKDILKEQYNEQVQTVKDARKDELNAIKTAQAEELAALKKQNDSEIAMMQQYRDDELKSLKRSQEDQLESIKDYNKLKLEEYKTYYSQQKEMAEAAAVTFDFDEEILNKAADLINQTIIDQSDIANKIGLPLERVKSIYDQIRRGEYKTFDDLGIGSYKGSKEGIEQLIKDASALSGMDLNADSYADIVQAIHIILEQQGIAGTTAKEGAETLEGSIRTMKAAWENFKLEIGKEDGDVQGAFENWMDTADIAFFDNILPRVDTVGKSVVNALTGSDIGTAWSEFWGDIGMGEFGEVFDMFEVGWNDIKEKVGEARVLFGLFGEDINSIKDIWGNVKDWFIERWDDITVGLADIGIWFSNKFQEAWDNVVSIWTGTKDWFSDRRDDIKTVFKNVGTWFKERFKEARDNIESVFSGIGTWASDRWGDVKKSFSGVGTWFKEKFQDAYDNVTSIWEGLPEFISGLWSDISNASKDGVNWIIGHLNDLLDSFEIGMNDIVDSLNDTLTVEIAGKKIGVEIPNVNIPEIPYLASGTVVPANYGEFLAVLGDNKREPEIVSPVSAIRSAVSDVIDRQGNGGGDVIIEKIEIVINEATGDIGKVGDLVVRKIDEALQRRKQLSSYGTGGVWK